MVLYVDDEARARKYFQRLFGSEFHVLTAGGCAEALDVLARRGEDVALLMTDQRMPAGDGVSLLSEVREHYPHIVRLLTTAYADIDDAIAAVNRGEVWRYITKPWNLETLRVELLEALELCRERQHERELLRERRRSMLSVASHIAHEMRTPLLAIRSASSGIERYLPRLLEGYRRAVQAGAPLEPIRERHVAVLEDAAGGIQRIVDRASSVIDLLLVNCGGKTIDPTSFSRCDIRDCVAEALTDYPFQGPERDLVHWDGEAGFIFHGSRPLMVFVLHNLLRNALRAVAAAGRREGRIRIWLTAHERENVLCMEDNGTGIPAEVLPSIFDDFASYSGGNGGIGIGLGFCARVMESFGGRIDCESEPGCYTRFNLWFPRRPERPATTEQAMRS